MYQINWILKSSYGTRLLFWFLSDRNTFSVFIFLENLGNKMSYFVIVWGVLYTVDELSLSLISINVFFFNYLLSFIWYFIKTL